MKKGRLWGNLYRYGLVCAMLACFGISGWSACAQQGTVHGGQQPVSGAHLYLFAISTSGVGASPISLLHGSGVTVDGAGNGYLTTSSTGGFNLTGLYAAYCPTSNSFVYMLSLGGNSGYGGNNATIAFVTAPSYTCSNLPNAPALKINELTTVAAVWALSPFASVATDSFAASSTTAAALTPAFAYANSLVSGFYGTVVTTAPYAKINTLANVIADCANTADTNPCSTLLADATPLGGTAPQDTLQAALDIVLNPTRNVGELYGIATAFSNNAYTPSLTAVPPDWNLTPTLTWATPIQIASGTPLSTSQLDATAEVPGTFAYTPASGTVLPVGSQTLTVTFTPTDLTAYASTSLSTVLQVDITSAACPASP